MLLLLANARSNPVYNCLYGAWALSICVLSSPFNVNFLELFPFYRYSKYAVCLLFQKERRLGRGKGQCDRVEKADESFG